MRVTIFKADDLEKFWIWENMSSVQSNKGGYVSGRSKGQNFIDKSIGLGLEDDKYIVFVDEEE